MKITFEKKKSEKDHVVIVKCNDEAFNNHLVSNELKKTLKCALDINKKEESFIESFHFNTSNGIEFFTVAKLKNYNHHHSLVHSKDYGVPQNRPRVLVIGIRRDIKSKINKDDLFPNKDKSYPHLEELFSDLIDKNYNKSFVTNSYLSDPKSKIQKILRIKKSGKSFLKKGDKLTDQEYSKHSPNIVKKFKSMLDNDGVIKDKFKTKKFAQRLLNKKWNGKGPNITATSLPDDYVHYSQPRSLTVREWARLQMFPDWYQFKGKRTTGGIRRAGNPQKGIFDREVPKYTQIGNAVPVELARRVGLSLKKYLK